MSKRCDICGNVFKPKIYNQKYCSAKCKRLGKLKRWNIRKQPTVRICIVCNKRFKINSSTQITCSKKCATINKANMNRLWNKTAKGIVAKKKNYAKRKLLLKNATCTLTAIEWNEILQEYKYSCAYCGVKFNEDVQVTVDHVTPLSKGGNHTKDNVVPACADCNIQKSDKDVEDFVYETTHR
jgi:5-methylcytosine-specific restriction endonuclease McrA